MNEEFRSFLPSIVLLGILALIAFFLTLKRGWTEDSNSQMRGTVKLAAFAVIFQAIHFSEEFATGLHESLPRLLGLPPLSVRTFVSFNITLLVIWCFSVLGLRTRIRAALFPLWFLGIASVMNVVIHPLLAIYASGYFPGLVTSPLVGVMGFLLLRRLLLVTESVGG